jgi:hypothetical protein
MLIRRIGVPNLLRSDVLMVFFTRIGVLALLRSQKKRWFRNGQKWRTGCERRISVIKRRHGLIRCRYKGDAVMKRRVGLGVIAAMEKQSHT